jgi:formate-dependent nitrite reductase membrane component NrfD
MSVRSATSPSDARSYYGRPILKEPVWKAEIPWYFFAGGLGGASAALGLGAELTENDQLARSASLVSLAALAVSPVLLTRDLGRPERFLNMFRVFKVTSPMSIGSWLLAAGGTATGATAALRLAPAPARLRRAAHWVSGLLGLPLATYTGALVADTAIPAWHEARRELPFLFAASSAASAGGASAMLVPAADAAAARRLGIVGGVAELGLERLLVRRLGFVGEAYGEGEAGRYAKIARGCTAAGTLALAVAGRRRAGAVLGGALLLGGSAALRWSVFKAGFQSARDPRYVVEPQRRRLATRS